MTFSAKKSRDSAQLEPFPFENLDGEPREAPHLKTFSLDDGERIIAAGKFREVLDEVSPGLGTEIASWPSHVVEDFMQAWLDHSGIVLPGGEPGKSSESSTTSASTAVRSRRTSRSGGSRSRR